MDKGIYRSRENRMVGGVCGGLGEYLGVDPTILRFLFFLLLFGEGVGFWLYLVLWILIPERDVEAPLDLQGRLRGMGGDILTSANRPHPKAGFIVGGGFIVLGVLLLLEFLDIAWLWWLDFDLLWPVLLIVIGIVIFVEWTR